MRVQSLTLVAAGAALLAPTAAATTPPAPQQQPRVQVRAEPMRAGPVRTGPMRAGLDRAQPMRAKPDRVHPSRAHPSRAKPDRAEPDAARGGAVRAAELLDKVRECAPVSRGRYRSDAGTPADIPVCGTRDAVFWKADMDIDCDGRPGPRCNRRTDPSYIAATAYTRSDGRPLDAERLPYVVVPAAGRIWDHRAYGVHGGSVAAVVHGDRVRYAVVGDTGPRDIIGEASYAAAEALGIDPDPRTGGTPSGVTYIVFRGSRVKPIEDRAAATRAGERLARLFARGG
ncbi:glycoside hydrolase family 75 protein [Streptomyces sp. NPDC006134]|uniref:glycoside hydrolase family 75 protein n=1 Tax=Streptomyces sp. NPDC006134 TaxID=3154467 RepID=UPI0033F57C1C